MTLIILESLLFFLALPGLVGAIALRDWRPLLWSLDNCVEAMLWLLGWPICALLFVLGRYRVEYVARFDRKVLVWASWWQRIYGNDEDGIDGSRNLLADEHGLFQRDWLAHTNGWASWRRILVWSCWRNPSGNLRFVSPFGYRNDPTRVRVVAGNSISPDDDHQAAPEQRHWFYLTHGAYASYWCNWPHLQVRIGWKGLPTDREGIPLSDYRARGIGFTLQVHRL